MTQYEVNHMENLMVRNDYWQDNYGVPEDDVDYDYEPEPYDPYDDLD